MLIVALCLSSDKFLLFLCYSIACSGGIMFPPCPSYLAWCLVVFSSLAVFI